MKTDNSKNVLIYGLGYVGLTLAVFLASRGYNVIGIEKNVKTLNKINSGNAQFYELGFDLHLKNVLLSGNFIARKFDKNSIPFHEFPKTIFVTVGTPVLNKKLNNENLREVLSCLSKFTSIHDLILLRSTVYPGCTREMYNKYWPSEGPKMGFAPERTIEGNAWDELNQLPQLISGLNEKALSSGLKFFQQIKVPTETLSTTEECELTKLFLNIERDVSFALANEFAMIAQEYNSNYSNIVKKSKNNYPRGKLQLPGTVGGPCLSKDSWILSEALLNRKNINSEDLLLKNARLINENLINWFIQKSETWFFQKSSKNIKILICGLSFKGKPATNDVRGSYVENIKEAIDRKCNQLSINIEYYSGYDALCGESQFKELSMLNFKAEQYDLVIIQNNNEENLKPLLDGSVFSNKTLYWDFWGISKDMDFLEYINKDLIISL